MLDVAVHIGTLGAVLAYFWRDLWGMARHVHQPKSQAFKLMTNVIIASMPVVIAGFIIHALEPSFICMLKVMAWMTLIFGVVLWVADKYSNAYRHIETMKPWHSLVIGLSQCLALVPGTSRSGITMTAARFLGYTRTDAARFSLLLSIIAISGAGVLSGYSLIKSGDFALGFDVVLAIIASFIVGWISIAVMMKWLTKYTFKPFAIYRIILGCILLYYLYDFGDLIEQIL